MPLTQSQKQTLAHCFLFEKLTPEEIGPFLETRAARRFAAGQEIYTASRFSRAIGVLTDGTATVRKGTVVMNTLRAGDCFGVAALFHPADEYFSTVQAKTAAELVFITDSELTSLFAQFPQTAVNYIAFLSQRIQFLNQKIDSFTAPSALASLGRYLAENQRDGLVVPEGGYSGLARRLNIGRASLYRGLEQLEREGVIRRTEKNVLVLDLEALRRL